MVHVEIPRRRPWAGIGLLAAVVLGLLVAVANIYAGLLLIALAAGGAVALALPAARGTRSLPVERAGAAEAGSWPAVAQQIVYDAEGVSRAAIAVPATSTDGYRPVLTSAGFVLVDETGKIVYKLKG